ncbi:AbrB family transcriptional regulator [Pararhodobacter marinus]|uniref:AbrB family transcriptional regulator n=1 Tax=Pararhodobacter marinus TaxID=2184063 RepID=UPI003518EF29
MPPIRLSSLNNFQRSAMTLALSGAGAALFYALHLPLPFLFGPMSACLLAALAGLPLRGSGQIGIGARTILGVAVGATMTPALLGLLPTMLASVALIPVYIALIGLIGVPYFRRVAGYDAPTAWYAAMPGGLQDMVVFGAEAGANIRTLSLIHATRVLLIVTVAPLLLTQAFGASLSHPVGEPAADLPVSEMALMIVAALVGWKGGERIGLFGASILGPLAVTAALSLAGFLHHRPPAEAIYVAQFFIGAAIGVGYTGVTLHEIRRDVLAGMGFVVILALLATLMAEIVYQLGLAPALEAFLAFAPGGQAEMTVLAIIVGADLGYIVVHHILRILLVITGAPIAARLMRMNRKEP